MTEIPTTEATTYKWTLDYSPNGFDCWEPRDFGVIVDYALNGVQPAPGAYMVRVIDEDGGTLYERTYDVPEPTPTN